jgi:hypothetical protein
LPDEHDARDRFHITPPAEAELVVATDDGTNLGLEYDADLTDRVSQLAETVG